jgi:FHA domain
VTLAYTRYTPAARNERWLFVSGRSFVAALEVGTARPVLDSLWWLADAEFASLESIVGAFPLAGANKVRSFAVASFEEFAAGAAETTVTAVVRGSACVDMFSVGGARRFQSEGVQPWVLADFRSVTGLTLGGVDHPTSPVAAARGESLPLGTGVVEGEALIWSLSPIEHDESVTEADALPAHHDDFDDDTIIVPRRAEQAGRFVPANPSPLPENPLPPGPVILPRADPGPVTASSMVVPDFTRMPANPVHPVPAGSLFGFRIGDREPVLLDAPAIIGRNPHPPRIVSGIPPRLITVRSPELEVSSTHVQLQQVGDSVVATDLRSTNGTFIVSDGRARERLRPGESRVLLPGATLEIGDGNIIEITPAGQVQ